MLEHVSAQSLSFQSSSVHWTRAGTRLVPDWHEICSYQSGTRLVPDWRHSNTRCKPNWYNIALVPDWYLSGTSLVPAWYQIVIRLVQSSHMSSCPESIFFPNEGPCKNVSGLFYTHMQNVASPLQVYTICPYTHIFTYPWVMHTSIYLCLEYPHPRPGSPTAPSITHLCRHMNIYISAGPL